VIELDGITKTYHTTERGYVDALRGVDLLVPDGEMVTITGESGSGTSTLMNILGCLDTPSAGHYRLNGVNVGRLPKRRLTKLRGGTIGFVFQSFDLVPTISVRRNVELPLMYSRPRVRRARAQRALERVGLAGHGDDMPVELFDAQRRKALIARALINEPEVLLVDEPTGALDSASAGEVMAALTALNDAGLTVVVSTHSEEDAGHAHRIVRLAGGVIVGEKRTGRRPPNLTVL
jgi:putative ABC transport system ATP-binding protein